MKIAYIKYRANLMLFMTALIWGATFVAQKTAMNAMGPFSFNGARCLLGAFSLFLLGFLYKDKQKVKKRHLIEGGSIAGTLLFIALGLQQIGIITTTAGHAGFISSLYIVLVPVFALVSGKKISKNIWLGVFFAIIGLYLLSVKGDLSIEKGDLSIIFSAVFFALHIMCISKYSKKTNPIKLSCMQFLVAGTFSMVAGLVYESFEIQSIMHCGIELFYAGVLSCAVAYTLQISAQRHVNPSLASLILSLESVFAVISAFFLLGEVLTIKETIGCLFMFSAVYFAESHGKKRLKLLQNK